MKKKKSGKNYIIIFGKLFFLIFVSLIITLMAKVIQMDVLPMKYLILVMIVFAVVLLIIGFLIFKRGIKFFIKLFSIFLEIVGTVMLCLGLAYLGKTVNFLNNIKNKLYQTEEYFLITLNESTLSSLEDVKGKEIGVYKDDINGNYNNSIIDLLNNQSVLLNEYEDYVKASEALLNKEVEVIFISGTYKTIVEEELEDFVDNTKVIHEIEVKIKAAEIAKEVDVFKEPFNVYISGIDTYGDIETVSRSDVNMVVTINPDTNEVLMTSIPRDYYVQLNGTSGYKDKLTHAGMYGIEKSVTTVEDLLGIDINYYVRVNFSTLRKLVDAIGGIEVKSEYAFTPAAGKSCKIKKGVNKLNGYCALAFARERKSFSEGDNQRIKNQQLVLKAIAEKALTSKTIVSKYSKILESFGGSFETNMPQDKIYDLIKMQLATMPTWEIEGQSLTGYDSYEPTYSLGSMEVYVMIPDEKTLKEAKDAIKKTYNAISVDTATKK